MRRLLLAAGLAAALPHAFSAPAAPLTPPMAQFGIAQQAMPRVIDRFRLDYASLEHKHSVANGPARSAQMREFYQSWRSALDALPFDSYGVDDRIDFVMLRNEIDFELRELAAHDKRFAEAEPLLPFVRPLIALTEARRAMQPQDGAASAAVLNKALAAVQAAHEALLAGGDIKSARPMASRSLANRAVQILAATTKDLKAWNA